MCHLIIWVQCPSRDLTLQCHRHVPHLPYCLSCLGYSLPLDLPLPSRDVQSVTHGQGSPVKSDFPKCSTCFSTEHPYRDSEYNPAGQQQFCAQAQTHQNQQKLLDLQDKYRTLNSQVQQSPGPTTTDFPWCTTSAVFGTAPQVLVVSIILCL